MTSEEAIKTVKGYDEFLKKGTQIQKPSQTLKIMKDGKTVPNKEQSIKINKYSKNINE